MAPPTTNEGPMGPARLHGGMIGEAVGAEAGAHTGLADGEPNKSGFRFPESRKQDASRRPRENGAGQTGVSGSGGPLRDAGQGCSWFYLRESPIDSGNFKLSRPYTDVRFGVKSASVGGLPGARGGGLSRCLRNLQHD